MKEDNQAKARRRPPVTRARAPELRTKGGTLLTPAIEAELAAEAEDGYDTAKLVPRKLVGRPSLSDDGGSSRQVSVRIDDKTYESLVRTARQRGQSVSELVRQVLQAAYGR